MLLKILKSNKIMQFTSFYSLPLHAVDFIDETYNVHKTERDSSHFPSE